MSIVQEDSIFPDFAIGNFDTKQLRSKSPLVIVVWSVQCPVSCMAMPFFERIRTHFPRVNFLGVSSDPLDKVQDYCQENKIHFDQASDRDGSVAESLGVSSVPSYWLIDSSGLVMNAGNGWSIDKVNDIALQLAKVFHEPYQPIVTSEDHVPAFKPG